MSRMEDCGIDVIRVNGRYPHGCGRFNSDDMYAEVQPMGEDIMIRIGDKERPEVWFDVSVERGKIQEVLEVRDGEANA